MRWPRLFDRFREKPLFITVTAPTMPVGHVWVDDHGQAWRITRHQYVIGGWGGMRHFGVKL